PPAKLSRKICSTGERLVVAISGDVSLEACIFTWFCRIEAARSMENTDRASFYEFFLLSGFAVCRAAAVTERLGQAR
ncbi:hypothetical protein Taro_035787, partial [Colocasia esculenta]|nr:hypothetical protein [Colocasia esculenta]